MNLTRTSITLQPEFILGVQDIIVDLSPKEGRGFICMMELSSDTLFEVHMDDEIAYILRKKVELQVYMENLPVDFASIYF